MTTKTYPGQAQGEDDVGRQLVDTATRLFGRLVDARVLAEAEQGIWPEAAWNAVAEAGLPLALLPDSAGGFGVPVADALSLLRIAGEHALPLPLAETMLAGWLLAGAGLDVPEGVLSVADGTGLALRQGPEGWRVSGRLDNVAWGRRADAVAVSVPGAQPMVVLLRAGSWQTTPDVGIAREPRDTLVLDAAAAEVSPCGHAGALHAAGAVTRGLMIAGALSAVSRMTVQYSTERVQFGRAIGKFQAVQQNLAILASQAAAAAAAADLGAEAMANGLPLPLVAVAKSRTGEAAGIGSAIAHQVHGAIGFTYEHRLHFFTKRMLGWRNEYGTEASWNRLLGRTIAAGGADALWPTLTGF